MNSDQNGRPIFKLCESEKIYEALEEYILSCCSDIEEENKTSKKQEARKTSFPNLAGFCRYLRSSMLEFEEASQDYPEQCAKILTALEDEALNSGFSPNLISAYLKKRLGYETPSRSSGSDTQLQIRFEHDIFTDGE